MDTPTDWISSIVVVAKSNNKIRLCIDPKPLYKALKRNDYAMPTIDDMLPDIQEARYFTHLDAKNGFWHSWIMIAVSALRLILRSGSIDGYACHLAYHQLRKSSSDEYMWRCMGYIPSVRYMMTSLCGGRADQEASEDHDNNLRKLLQSCREVNLK